MTESRVTSTTSKVSGAQLVAAVLGAGVAAAGLMTAMASKRETKFVRSFGGKTALITGGSRGLGLELARQLGQQGCQLMLVARDATELETAVAELRQAGVTTHSIAADVSRPYDIRRIHEQTAAAYGRVDILINNAGLIVVGPIESLKEDDFQRAMDVMYWGMVRVTLAFLPDLVKSGDADIVNITSVGGKIAVPHLLPYSSAKFAATGFSQGLGAELRGKGVHVLTVAPGLMRTGSIFHAEFTGDAGKEYRWFALGASLPGVSMDVRRAAAQVLQSLDKRERELTITLMAQLGARVYRIFPEWTQAAIEKVNELLLPNPTHDSRHRAGREMDGTRSGAFHAATTLGRQAAVTQNEQPSETVNATADSRS